MNCTTIPAQPKSKSAWRVAPVRARVKPLGAGSRVRNPVRVAIGGYEGGQMPLYRRLPKRGFSKPNQLRFAVINLGLIEKFISLGKLDIKGEITEDALVAAGLTGHKRDGIRILNKGDIKSKVNLVVSGASATAVEAVKAAGGNITLLAPKPAAAE
jgi:large subunit ribosomal protein L15